MDDVLIQAESIWIKAGALYVGSAQSPYLGNLTIEIIGERMDKGFVID